MRKIISLFPTFKEKEKAQVEEIIKNIFGNTKHNCEIIILRSSNNPQYSMDTIYGIIGSEEDEKMAINYVTDQIGKAHKMKSMAKCN